MTWLIALFAVYFIVGLRRPGRMGSAYVTILVGSVSFAGSMITFAKLQELMTTRPVVLETTFEGRGTDPWGNARVGYEARTVISRKEFGLAWNQALETGGVLVGDEVKIEISVEAIAQ